MKESLIEKKICQYAKEKKWLVFKMVSINQRGIPDRIFLKNKFIFFIEFKSGKNKTSFIQNKNILNLKKNNFFVFIVNNLKDGIEIINKMEYKIYERNKTL